MKCVIMLLVALTAAVSGFQYAEEFGKHGRRGMVDSTRVMKLSFAWHIYLGEQHAVCQA